MISGIYTDGQVLLMNKPLRWTSFDVVRKIRYLTKTKKVGHAGTLDPLATGLLIVCTGKKTKEIQTFQDLKKEYTGTFFIGATTPYYDLEKPIDHTFPTEHITEELILATVKSFMGKQEQVPPLFSAVMVNGKRA